MAINKWVRAILGTISSPSLRFYLLSCLCSPFISEHHHHHLLSIVTIPSSIPLRLVRDPFLILASAPFSSFFMGENHHHLHYLLPCKWLLLILIVLCSARQLLLLCAFIERSRRSTPTNLGHPTPASSSPPLCCSQLHRPCLCVSLAATVVTTQSGESWPALGNGNFHNRNP